ncbi:MAG: F0F1 ATP synthase subunit B, partial [Campylobacter sp.]|nr:F0F1 ATP synthase subunit B [Campylobacter sp.]
MKSKILLLLCPFVLMADGGYDIVPRTINFIVFAAILYYL